jgi:1,4-dihydroxy-2-naphthoyl-CoA synthase
MAQAEREASPRLGEAAAEIVRSVRVRPWPTLLVAMLAGYVLGGGFFSRMTRPLARAAMGALLVPGFRERVVGAARSVTPRGGASMRVSES